MPRRDAAKKVIDHLKLLLAHKTVAPGSFLPSIRQLAHSFKTSPNTVHKAIRILAGQKHLIIEKCCGVRVTPVHTNTPPNQPDNSQPIDPKILGPTYAWERAAGSIKHDILNNRFEYGKRPKLPSIKELENRYGISYVPIKKAVAFLKKKGIVAPDGTIAISFPHDQRFTSTIILLVDELDVLDERQYNVLRMLEFECKTVNISLKTLDSSAQNADSIKTVMESHMVLGFIFFCYKIQFRERNNATFRYISSRGLPVAAITDDRELWSHTPPKTQFFSFGAIDAAGKHVAHYLAPLGHKHIAFFSTWHSIDFSIQRSQSLTEAFKGVDPAHTVNLFTNDSPAYFNYPFPQYGPGITPVDASAIPKETPLTRNKTYRDLFPAIKKLYTIAQSEPHLFSSIVNLESTHGKVALTDTFYYSLKPLFEQALANPQITAWVCVDDIHALPALHFLKKTGKRVPEDISVVGFEDIHEALTVGLTTYNFNIPALISHCLRFIQYPRSAFDTKSKKPIEIVGHVMERRTTGPAKSRA